MPLIIRGPNVPENATRDQFVSNIDLAPTIVGITRAQPLRVMDGISLLPLIRDPTSSPNRDLLFESDIGAYGMRRGPWKYTAWDNGDEELYNLDNDPYELENLLYDRPGPAEPSPDNIALADQLRARLDQLKVCAGVTCR